MYLILARKCKCELMTVHYTKWCRFELELTVKFRPRAKKVVYFVKPVTCHRE